ncbi:MAG: DNA polymerase III subunit alpha [Bacteroidaceae bacterium]|nr:DNA polymerase III subunit alpha [Bacteroidaceae bacterium]
MEDFVHLHVHTQYSILDGQSAIPKLVDKALKDHMRGMAVTDHGNMMGIKEFYNYTKKKKGGAKDNLKLWKGIRESLTNDEGKLPELQKEHKELIGKKADEVITLCDKKIAAAEEILRFKPIFGCEMYVAHRRKSDRNGREDQSGWHLIVLAKNEKGYHNLIKLVSRAWTDGFYMRPRTDHEDLEHYKEGLIVASACLGGEIPQYILKGELAAAEKSVAWFKNTFGRDFYLELQRHKVKDPAQRANRETYPAQQKVNTVLLELAKKYDVKLICTNDCHFVDEENAEAHDRLICLSTNRDLDDPNRMLYSKQEWFKTREEMNEVFADVPEALSNTCVICDEVEEYSIDHGPIMPNFDIPKDFGTEEEYRQKFSEQELFDEFTRDENGQVTCSEEEGRKKIEKLGGYEKLYRIKLEADYLAKLAYEGAKERYGEPLSKEIDDRIRFELHVMKTMGFPGYFLIVQDYINVARKELDVSVGPGRGSAAGSAVAYCLGITQIDPIKYDLLFERFLNPDRISLPDIDVDFDDDGRGRVLDWVTKKYGEEKVAHIITYGTMATKLAIKDVARVEKLPLSESNRLCKAIPDKLPEGPDGKVPKMNLPNAIAAVPELREAESSDNPLLRETIKYAKMLEGNIRNTGVHACGTIICRDDISDWVPVSTADDKETGEKLRCTQYEGSVIEETGLIKMDFLGLKTLSILREAIFNIKKSLNIDIDLDKLPLDDPATYQLFCDGKTIGTFQFESTGMQKYLRELQPSTFEDLIAMNALYRPGPMQYIPQFINRKHGKEVISYDLPCMEKYLKETYGITVYQEQVMLLSRLIADFTRGESDTLRKAMGKKQIDKLNHLHPKFIEGGKKNGYDETTLNKIWKDWESFASYAFNKSHATCYSWVAYQTAYLKANFPPQYMAAVMSRSLDNITDITKLMDECKAMGIQTLIPDVNESNIKFSVNNQNNIRFGMGGIKGVGAAAVDCIVKEREQNGLYKDYYDLVERIDLSTCNKRVIENLILAGAFDCFGLAREQYFEVTNAETFLESLFAYGQTFQKDKLYNSNTLFGDMEAFEITKPMPQSTYRKWTTLDKLNKERNLIGIYLSAHPLDPYKVVLSKMCTLKCNQLQDDPATFANQELMFGGIVTNVREGVTQRNTAFGIVKMEDYSGQGELALFGDDWSTYRNLFVEGNALFITAASIPKRWNASQFEIKIQRVEFLADIKDNNIQKITIKGNIDAFTGFVCNDLLKCFSNNRGNTAVYFHIVDKDNNVQINLKSQSIKIDMSKEVVDCLDHFADIEYAIN